MMNGTIHNLIREQAIEFSSAAAYSSFRSFQDSTNSEDLKTVVTVSSLRSLILERISEKNPEKSFDIFTTLHPTSFNKHVVGWLYPDQKQSLLQRSLSSEKSTRFKKIVESMISSTCKGIIVEFDSKFAITTNLLRLEGYNTLAMEKNMSNVRAAHAAGMQNIVHGDHTDLERVLNGVGNRQVCAAVKFVYNENVDDLPNFLDHLNKFQKSGDKLVLPFVDRDSHTNSPNREVEALHHLTKALTSLLESHGYRVHMHGCDVNESDNKSRLQCAVNSTKSWLKRVSSFRKEVVRTDGLQFSDSSLLIAEKM
ncbi:MAG: hypothetical protein NWR73_08880 [Flavobacteriales bacterium]|nr:hypothetical protein [Flavobacteriales bacterium]